MKVEGVKRLEMVSSTRRLPSQLLVDHGGLAADKRDALVELLTLCRFRIQLIVANDNA